MTFGKLRVIRMGHPKRDKHGNYRWVVQCECGSKAKTIVGSDLRSGHTQSCGCLNLETPKNFKHGNARAGEASAEYRTWQALKNRCLNKNSPKYNRYGGRGISVCDKWLASFVCFLEDVGPRPSSKHQLDRIDNDGDYAPSNCRWALPRQQARNRRSNRLLTYKGETLCVAAMADKYSVDARVLWRRIDLGWSIEEALTLPVVSGFKRSSA